MGYLHINNLYKDQSILLFRECYALEKVHGTSAHIAYTAPAQPDDPDAPSGKLTFFSGGESHERFTKLFPDHADLRSRFEALGHTQATVYGEAYGGKQQGMRETYGPDLRFIVFDVKVGDCWLSVPDMTQVAESLGLEVVPWCKTSTDLEALDALRDAPSEVAVRRGCGQRPREGVILRPLIELTKNNGERIIAKHKGETFSERATPQKIVDPAKLAVLAEAEAIAQEWVTPMRLEHVLQKIPDASMEQMRDIIAAMVEDVYREGKGEIVESREASAAIGKRTAALFKDRLKARLR